MRIITVVATLLLATNLQAQCRKCQPQIKIPTLFYPYYDSIAYNCCPSRQDLYLRLQQSIRKGCTPYMALNLFTKMEKEHLQRGLLSARPNAIQTWFIVTNGQPLPMAVQQKIIRRNQQQIVRDQQLEFRRLLLNYNSLKEKENDAYSKNQEGNTIISSKGLSR